MEWFGAGEVFVDRFRLVAHLGSGAQANVFRAIDLGSGVEVALKLVSLADRSPDLIERTRREANALSEMRHPSLVRCRGFHEDSRRQALGLVLDLVSGSPLSQCEERLGDAQRLAVLHHVVTALAYLHSRGVAHRDIKPENVLLGAGFAADPGNGEHVKLIDLGISTRAGRGRKLTEEGRVLGTPDYLAPEILAPGIFLRPGEAPEDALRDVFAVGVLGMRLLERRHPTGLEWGLPAMEYAESYCSYADSGEAFPVAPGRYAPFLRASLALHREKRSAAGLLLDLLPAPPTRVPVSLSIAGARSTVAPYSGPVAVPSSRGATGMGWVLGGAAILVALVALAFIVRYVLIQLAASDDTPPVVVVPTGTQARPVVIAPTGAPVAPPVVDVTARAVASSSASSELEHRYHARYAYDGSVETAWCEGAMDDGVGSYIDIDLAPAVTVVAMDLTGGWAWNSPAAAKTAPPGDMWALSNVATRLDVDAGGTVIPVTFSREADRGRAKRVTLPPRTTRIRITVRDVSRTPTSGNNVCLDGIRLLGY